MFNKVRKDRKRSKTGKIITVAAAAIAALALAPNANAATITMNVDTPRYETWDHAVSIDLGPTDGWRPTSSGCDSTGAQDSSGATVYHYFNQAYGNELRWIVSTNSYSYGHVPYIDHASFSCDVTKVVKTTTHPMVWKTITQRRNGTNTSSRSHSSSCYTDNFLNGELRLDCWGGTYAQASYHFALPSDARNISRSISVDPRCCQPGTVTKSWSGNTATVRVTNWKSAYVGSVKVTYQHRVRTTKNTYTTLHATGIGQF
jgi:hypothetical protein